MESSSSRLDTLQSIELAEGVEVRLRTAGPLLRAGALLIDLAIQAAIMLGVGMVVGLVGLATSADVSQGLILLTFFFMSWWYPTLFEFMRGATPGKKAMGLRVVQSSGSPITFGQAVVRNFLRFIDQMPLWGVGTVMLPSMAFGLISCISTRRFQRLGDLAAGTVVVYDRVLPEPMVNAPPPMEAKMPGAILRPDEVRAVVAFRERAGLWSEGRRAEISDHAEELTGAKGLTGVSRLMAIAYWLQERR